MKIRFECECGKPLVAQETMVGRRAKCPKCGRSVEVPQTPKPPKLAAASVDNEDFFANLMGQSLSASDSTQNADSVESGTNHSTEQVSIFSEATQLPTTEVPHVSPNGANSSTKSAAATLKLPRASRTMILGAIASSVLIVVLLIVWFWPRNEQNHRQTESRTGHTSQPSNTAVEVPELKSDESESPTKPSVQTASATNEPQTNQIEKPKQATEVKGLEQLIPTIEPAVVRLDVSAREGSAIGSGFVIDDTGIVVTNNHVVEGATSAKAAFADGTSVAVIGILAADPKRDIAILKIQGTEKKFPSLKLWKGSPPKGLAVVAFGAPKGLSFSASEGIVSAVRSGKELADFGIPVDGAWIQTTTPISPGNSGGPLVARSGEVVGINTFNIVKGQNLNFAVSATDIERIFESAKSANPLPLGLTTSSKGASDLIGKEVGSFKIPPKFNYPHQLVINSEKGKFDTYRRIELGPVRLDNATAMFLLLVVTDDDRVADNGFLLINSVAENWRFRKFRTLKIIADGELTNLGEMSWDPEVKTTGLSVYCVERLNTPVPLRVLLKIARSKDSDIAVGSSEYSLGLALRDGLRDALSRLPLTKTVSGIALEIDQQIESENTEIANAEKKRETERQSQIRAAVEKAEKEEQLANEKKANRSLSLVKKLIDDGKTKLAKEALERIIKNYPETAAQREAEELLKKLKD